MQGRTRLDSSTPLEKFLGVRTAVNISAVASAHAEVAGRDMILLLLLAVAADLVVAVGDVPAAVGVL
jgi:hypothetical protein